MALSILISYETYAYTQADLDVVPASIVTFINDAYTDGKDVVLVQQDYGDHIEYRYCKGTELSAMGLLENKYNETVIIYEYDRGAVTEINVGFLCSYQMFDNEEILTISGVEYKTDDLSLITTESTTTVNAGYSIEIDGPREVSFLPYGTVTYNYILNNSNYLEQPFPDYGTVTTSENFSISLSDTEWYTLEVVEGAIDVVYTGESNTEVDIEDNLPIIDIQVLNAYITVENNTSSIQEFYIQSKDDVTGYEGSYVYYNLITYNLSDSSGHMVINDSGDDWTTLTLQPYQSIYLELKDDGIHSSSFSIDLNDLNSSEIKFTPSTDIEQMTTLTTRIVSDKNTWRIINYKDSAKTISVDTTSITGWVDTDIQVYFIPIYLNSNTGKYYVDVSKDMITVDKNSEDLISIPPGGMYDLQSATGDTFQFSYYMDGYLSVQPLFQSLYSEAQLGLAESKTIDVLIDNDINQGSTFMDEIDNPMESTGFYSYSVAEYIEIIKGLFMQSTQFLALFSGFLAAMPPPIPQVFATVIIIGPTIFFIRLIRG
jgi:hypothetical protein